MNCTPKGTEPVRGVAENLASGAGLLLQLIKLANASVIKARTAIILVIVVRQCLNSFITQNSKGRFTNRPYITLRLTGALLASASGMASGEVNIVPFSERILTFGCGDGESHGVVTVLGIGVSRVLLGAVDGAIVIKVPGPGGYVAC